MTDDRLQRNALGEIGRRVRDNVKTLRKDRGLTHQQLADRTTELGRPIPVLGISRIENGARRVDVDDLSALAAALEVDTVGLLAAEPAATLAAFDYERHRERIQQLLMTLADIADDGIDPDAVIDYVRQAMADYPRSDESGAPAADVADEIERGRIELRRAAAWRSRHGER